MVNQTSDGIARLAEMIATCQRGVAFTGAGISTLSGIPDFRSKDGLWTKNQPIQFQDFVSDPAMRREAWRRKFAIEPVFKAARPTVGHIALAGFVARGRFTSVITQNIDNLHQISGIPDEQIIELHGNGSYARCLGCKARYELGWVQERLAPDWTPPDCAACGGLIKAATISFGQSMPSDAMDKAHRATIGCDLFIVVGSSLVVYPAAGFPMLAKQSSARLVIINRDPTELDGVADLVINADIGDVFAPFVASDDGSSAAPR